MRPAELANVHWHKSSYSNGSGGACVEVGSAPGAALVRDSKQRGAGPVLGFAVVGWRAFTAGVLAGTFER